MALRVFGYVSLGEIELLTQGHGGEDEQEDGAAFYARNGYRVFARARRDRDAPCEVPGDLKELV